MVDLLFYIFGLLLSFVSAFFKPPFLKSQMEFSNAPRSDDFGGGDVFLAGAWEGGGGGGAGAWGGGGTPRNNWEKDVLILSSLSLKFLN